MKNSPREGRQSHSAVEIKQIHIFSAQKQILRQQQGTLHYSHKLSLIS